MLCTTPPSATLAKFKTWGNLQLPPSSKASSATSASPTLAAAAKAKAVTLAVAPSLAAPRPPAVKSLSLPVPPPPPSMATSPTPAVRTLPKTWSMRGNHAGSRGRCKVTPIWSANPPQWNVDVGPIPDVLDELIVPLPALAARNLTTAVCLPFYSEGESVCVRLGVGG